MALLTPQVNGGLLFCQQAALSWGRWRVTLFVCMYIHTYLLLGGAAPPLVPPRRGAAAPRAPASMQAASLSQARCKPGNIVGYIRSKDAPPLRGG